MKQGITQHAITIAGVDYRLANDRLRISRRNDTVLDICLSPTLDGEPVRIAAWEETGHNSYKASLGRHGAAFICEKLDKLAFWIETPVKQFQEVTYLSDGIISGDHWRTFASDEHERLWDKKIDTNIPISSAYADSNSPDGVDNVNTGMTDPADVPVHWIWNVHVRAFALKGSESWLGVSIPGPWGIGVTRLNMRKTRFNLRFEYLHTGCTDGKMPCVYFCPGLTDGFDVLDEHRKLSEKLALMDLTPKDVPGWWSNPWYYYYDEMKRQMHNGLITKGSVNVINLLGEWIKTTQAKCDFKQFNVPLEQDCYRLYGDYRPAEIMGTEKDVRAAIDAWHTEGIHVGHYIHPFVVNTKVKFFQEHPEAFCKPKDPDFLMDYPLETFDKDNPKFAPVDWTHPLGREFILNWVDYFLSSAQGCLNCDILRSNNWRSPDPRCYDFHDPDWGIGDMMTYKVQRLLYERAKEIKPDCMVTKISAVDCYMQPVCDAMQMSEDWTHNMQAWYRRGQVATRLMRNIIMGTDAWFLTRTKADEFFMAMLVWNWPDVEAVTHATHCYFPRWVPLAEKRFRRRKAGIHAYLNSPLSPSDECRVTWEFENLEIYRRKTRGPLAGWYGALALSPKCFVTYSEKQALVVASENRLDWVPLPPGATLDRVTRVLHDGDEREYEHVHDEKARRIQMYIEDCGKDVFCYRIRYRLTKGDYDAKSETNVG